MRSIRVVGQVGQRQQRLREGRKRRRGVRRRRLCQREEFALRGLEQGLSRTVVEGVEVGVDGSRRPAWVISVRARGRAQPLSGVRASLSGSRSRGWAAALAGS